MSLTVVSERALARYVCAAVQSALETVGEGAYQSVKCICKERLRNIGHTVGESSLPLAERRIRV